MRQYTCSSVLLVSLWSLTYSIVPKRMVLLVNSRQLQALSTTMGISQKVKKMSQGMEFFLTFFKLTTVCLPVWNWSNSVFRIKWLSWLVESDLIFCGGFCVFVAESELLAYGHISWSVFTQGIRESHGSMPRALSSISQLRAFSKHVKHKTSTHI